MFIQLPYPLRSKARIIGNFIDEHPLEKYRCSGSKPLPYSTPASFAFVGNLIPRKGLSALLRSILMVRDLNPVIHILGEGPCLTSIETYIKVNSLSSNVVLHGYVQNPLEIVSMCSYLILPSYSEGVSRAVLEALFIGIPCILRRVDANPELIISPLQGYLFDTDDMLPEILREAILSASSRSCDVQNLLPADFRRETAKRLYDNFFVS